MSQKISFEIAQDRNDASESTSDNIFRDVKSIVELAIRRFWTISIAAALVFGLIGFYTFTQTPQYTSTATVIVDSKQTNVIDLGAVLSGAALNTAVIDTEVRVMGSKALLAKVVEKENLIEDPEFNPTLIPPKEPGMLARLLPGSDEAEETEPLTEEDIKEIVLRNLMWKVQVSRVGTTYLMQVTVTSESAENAARLANAIAEQYGLEQLEVKLEATARATRYLAERVETLEEEVSAKEILVENYRSESGLLAAQGATLTEANIALLQRQRVELEGEVARLRARYDGMRRQLNTGAGVDAIGEVLDSAVIAQLKTQLSEARRRRAELSTSLGPEHPRMIAVLGEISDYEQQMTNEASRIVDNLRVELDVANDQIAALDRRIGQSRSNLARNNRSQVRLNELEREAEASRLILEEFVQRFKQTREQDELVQPDSRVLSPASVPVSPSSPRKMLNLIIGMLLGGCVGVSIAIALEIFNNQIRSVEEIERKFGFPSLGAVPLIRSLKFLGFGSRVPADFLIQDPLSAYAESMRYLRASIAISAMEEGTKTVTIASSLPDEGKTSLTLSLGRMSALSGDKTLVIDGDFRRRQLTASAGISPETGLVEFLLGECELEEAIYREEHTGLDLLALTPNGKTLFDVFGTKSFDTLLAQLKTQYDLILIDTAPLLLIAEAGVIASKTDKTILILRWMRSRRTSVRRSLEMLKSMKADVLGLALNMVDLTKKRHHTEQSSSSNAYRKYYTTESKWRWLKPRQDKSVVPIPAANINEPNEVIEDEAATSQLRSLLNKG
ncbi:MAG: polysaccharide biosynthesis tyrosine autokinase [Henriciella sp.]|nr:polysaccharide biosynthesis tyrosine autokinase [Henriciella sp.]